MSEPTPTDRFNTPLLTLITQQSLDEDYQHVADRKATSGSADTRSRPLRLGFGVRHVGGTSRRETALVSGLPAVLPVIRGAAQGKRRTRRLAVADDPPT